MLVKETWDSQQDVLGEIFTAEVSYGENGQFFTPSHVTDMIVKMLYANEKREAVNDPACGSGRFFISMGKINKNIYCYGVDLATICAKMTALNMWLFDLDADIFCGDSLRMKMSHVWKMRSGGFIFEAEVKEEEQPLPKPVVKAMKARAEQQQLFGLEKH